MAGSDLLARTHWSDRSRGFGDLSGDAFPVMAFGAEERSLVPDEVWALWCALPRHRHVVRPVEARVLHYAAIDWARRPTVLGEPHDDAFVATLGAKLTRVAELLLQQVPCAQLPWMLSPELLIDLQGEPRIVFVHDATRRPPEDSPDERSTVFMVGRLLRDVVADSSNLRAHAVGHVIRRCLEPSPGNRFATLQDVRDALRLAGGARVEPASAHVRGVWDRLEEGIGFLALGRPTDALARFEEVLAFTPASRRAAELQAEALRRGANLDSTKPAGVARNLTWADVEPRASAHEANREFGRALALYDQVTVTDRDRRTHGLATARCQLAEGRIGEAASTAEMLLGLDAHDCVALSLRADSLVRIGRHAEALDVTSRWLGLAPDEATAHYLRGKSLLGLGRPVEARYAFERASLLQPSLLEAMLLRREADRVIKNARTSVGIAAAQTLEVPPHLPEVRDLLVRGRIADAIFELRQHRDAAAQLLLGTLLSYDGQFAKALAVFESIRSEAAQLGAARALLDLDRAEEALAIFDRLTSHPDAAEGRARALAKLGHHAEAEAAFRRYVTAAGDRSALRVRAVAP